MTAPLDTPLAWKLVMAAESIQKASEALERMAEAEMDLRNAQQEYESALQLFRVAEDETGETWTDGDAFPISLKHNGATLLSLICNRYALEQGKQYGFSVKKAFEYGFRQWAQGEEGKLFIRNLNRRLRSDPHQNAPRLDM